MPHLRSQGPPLDFAKLEFEVGDPSFSAFNSTPFPTPPNSPSSSPPHVHMAENQTVHQQATNGFTGISNPITIPAIANDSSWQIPSYVMTAIANNCQFHGREDEDAPAHIGRLERIGRTFKLQGATDDAIFLQLFPFSLTDRAATWLESHAAGTFTTWSALRERFLNKYFPPAKASRLRDEIHSFKMEPDEPYYRAWERFQNLLSRCSQHGLSDWALVEKFYNGLTYETRARFDTSAGGHLMGKKNVTECNEMFESFAQAEYEQRSGNRNSSPATSSSSRGVHHVTMDTSVAAALESLVREVKELKKKVDRCELCRGDHATSECPLIGQEQASYVGNNSYNSGWRNQNNWRSSGAPPGFQQNSNHNQGQGGSSGGSSGQGSGDLSRIENLLTQLVVKDAKTQQILAEHDILLKNQQSAFLDLQRTVGDIAKRLDERPTGQFPGNPNPNPNAHVKAITTRSGKQLGEVKGPVLDERVESEEKDEVEVKVRSPVREFRPPVEIDHARIPYPERVRNQKYVKDYGHFLDMFKQLKINLPFIEVLQCMPKYAKFLKDILKNKSKLGELSSVSLSGECSAVVMNQLPEKLADPGIFTIPCLFGSDVQCHALADLGASINLMPFSLYEKLGLGELSPTRMTLSLADKSIKYPRGIIENLLVKVGKFVFPVDFVVLDMEADERVPIILGRPFLRTAKANIDVFRGTITLHVGDESVVFEVANSVRGPSVFRESVSFVSSSEVDDRKKVESEKKSVEIPVSRIVPGSSVRYIPSPEEVKKLDWGAYFDSIDAQGIKSDESECVDEFESPDTNSGLVFVERKYSDEEEEELDRIVEEFLRICEQNDGFLFSCEFETFVMSEDSKSPSVGILEVERKPPPFATPKCGDGVWLNELKFDKFFFHCEFDCKLINIGGELDLHDPP